MNPALAARARAAFATAFGAGEPLLFSAPGRVNLIGEHTDYNDGFVLPMPIARETIVAARALPEPRIDLFAADLGERDSFPIDRPIERAGPTWSLYARGMAAMLHGAGVPLAGAALAIAGDVPQGGGLSSSASLEVAVGRALAALSGSTVPARQLALAAQRAEHDYAGCPCGIMDQLAAAEGSPGRPLLIDCRSLATQSIPLPHGAAVLIVDSGVRHSNAAGGYGERRAQCEAAARMLGVAALRDIDLAGLEASGYRLDPLLFRRARHVVTENARVLEAAEALRRGDLAGLGALFAASHRSMRDDFEITIPAIDAIVELAGRHLGGAGGARMTGGGFGGSVIAVGRRPELEALAKLLGERGYRAIFADD